MTGPAATGPATTAPATTGPTMAGPESAEGPAPGDTPAALLRQMIAALESERQALAALDAEELTEAARIKERLCSALAPLTPDALDGESRALAETARRLNEINRRVRNLLAANVAARLAALGGEEHAAGATYGAAAPAPLRPHPGR